MVEIKFMGITQNVVSVIGRVIEPPKFMAYGEGECAILQMKTVNRNLDTNTNQWVDEACIIPVMITQQKQVQTVHDYVAEGRQLMIAAYIKTWDANGAPQMAIVAKTISLGDKPYSPDNEGSGDGGNTGSGGGSSLPPI